MNGTLGTRHVTCAGFWDGTLGYINTARHAITLLHLPVFLRILSKKLMVANHENSVFFSKIVCCKAHDCSLLFKTTIKTLMAATLPNTPSYYQNPITFPFMQTECPSDLQNTTNYPIQCNVLPPCLLASKTLQKLNMCSANSRKLHAMELCGLCSLRRAYKTSLNLSGFFTSSLHPFFKIPKFKLIRCMESSAVLTATA